MQKETQLFLNLLDLPEFREGDYWYRKRYVEGQTIIEEGDQSNNFFIILDGIVRVVGNVMIDQNSHIKPGFCELSRGEVFGEFAIFDDNPRSASVVAVSPCELAVIRGDHFLHYLDEHPQTGYKLLKEMLYTAIGRLRRTNAKLFSLFAWGLRAHRITDHL